MYESPTRKRLGKASPRWREQLQCHSLPPAKTTSSGSITPGLSCGPHSAASKRLTSISSDSEPPISSNAYASLLSYIASIELPDFFCTLTTGFTPTGMFRTWFPGSVLLRCKPYTQFTNDPIFSASHLHLSDVPHFA